MWKQQLNGLMKKRYLFCRDVSIRQKFQTLDPSRISSRYWLLRCRVEVGRLWMRSNSSTELKDNWKKLIWRSSKPWSKMFMKNCDKSKTKDPFLFCKYIILFILYHCIFDKKSENKSERWYRNNRFSFVRKLSTHRLVITNLIKLVLLKGFLCNRYDTIYQWHVIQCVFCNTVL
jgi:hypothetical protein